MPKINSSLRAKSSSPQKPGSSSQHVVSWDREIQRKCFRFNRRFRLTPCRNDVLLFALLLLLLAPLFAANPATNKKIVLVKYKDGRANQAHAKTWQSFGVSPRRSLGKIGVHVLPVPAGETQASFLKKLKQDPDVEFAEPNNIVRALDAPNDPSFSLQYYLPLIEAPAAWDITQGSTDVVVAVIDTGVVLTHPDLDDNLWVNPSTTALSGINGAAMEIDLDENGACNDVHDACVTNTDAGSDQCASNDPSADDAPTYHGTHSAGLIAAETNNATNIAGLARNSRIMAVKALNNCGAGTDISIADAIIYSTDNGAQVINLSLGSPVPSQTIEAAVNYAVARNRVLVASAGNKQPCKLNYPAAYERVISVGATDQNDNLTSFSCTGAGMDVVAPGLSILSLNGPTGTSSLSGTSFSAPLVSGVAALILAVNPTLTVSEVTKTINFNADDLGAGGYDNTFGFGRLNARRAVEAAANGQTTYTSNPGYAGETFAAPNPFRPRATNAPTQIFLPSSLGSDGIEVVIYTVAGEEVKTLHDTNGEVLWDGRNSDGNLVASGVYIYYAKTSKGDIKGKLTVIK